MTSAAALVRRHATNLRRVAASAVGRDSTYGTGRSHPATQSEVLFDPAALGHLLPQHPEQQSQPVLAQHARPFPVITGGLEVSALCLLDARPNVTGGSVWVELWLHGLLDLLYRALCLLHFWSGDINCRNNRGTAFSHSQGHLRPS
jgi:hypothetical protein